MSPTRSPLTPTLLVCGALLSAFACSGTEAPPPAPPPEAAPEMPAQIPVPAQAAKPGISTTLVPSPRELATALAAAGIDTQLASLVTDHTYHTEANDIDRVAVRTGVVVADTLLTLKTAPDDKLLANLAHLQHGMQTLGGGADIDATLTDLSNRVKAGAVDRDALLGEIDELAQAVIPELNFNGVERIVPLIQAGSWLEGANLVAKAAKAKATPAAASGILKQPDVVAYFKRYAKETGEAKVPSEVATTLDASLSQLDSIAGKAGQLDATDLDTVITATDAVLALL